MELPPGTFDLVLAGIENRTGMIAAGRVSVEWADKDGVPRIAPIAVLQPTSGAFSRKGDLREEGSLVIDENQPVQSDRPTAFITLVCRAGRSQDALRVERTLAGQNETSFPPIDLDLREAPCAQVRDLVPAATLSAGSFTYSVSVEGTGETKSRQFVVK